KSLSTRTHVCPHCGYTDCRDRNAALNILQKGLSSVGRTQT
ncbi:MAG: transposase, partial [Microcystis novacekii Mn_MB_F_20050700_S1]